MRNICAISMCVFLTSCSYGYKLKNSQVYWTYSNAAVGNSKRLLSEADAKSLQKFQFKAYAKDKSNAYYEGKIIHNADVNTFKPLSNFYSVDKNHAYYGDMKIQDADGESFSLLEGAWTKDKSDVYYGINAIDVCDLPTFSIRYEYFNWWAVDSKCVYFKNRKIPIKDRKTLKILQHGYAKDKYQVYYEDKIVAGADPYTFHTKHTGFTSKDKYSCYKFERKIACDK